MLFILHVVVTLLPIFLQQVCEQWEKLTIPHLFEAPSLLESIMFLKKYLFASLLLSRLSSVLLIDILASQLSGQTQGYFLLNVCFLCGLTPMFLVRVLQTGWRCTPCLSRCLSCVFFVILGVIGYKYCYLRVFDLLSIFLLNVTYQF